MPRFNDKQQLILAAMQAKPSVTNEALAEVLNVHKSTIDKQLSALKHMLKAATRQSLVPLAFEAGWRPAQSLAEIVDSVLDINTPPSPTRRADMQAEAVGIAANRLITYVRFGNEKGASVPVEVRYAALITLNHEVRREADRLESILQSEKQIAFRDLVNS